jgi:hypothetical protein
VLLLPPPPPLLLLLLSPPPPPSNQGVQETTKMNHLQNRLHANVTSRELNTQHADIALGCTSRHLQLEIPNQTNLPPWQRPDSSNHAETAAP